jgi:galactokinase
VQASYPKVTSLRDVTLEMLEECIAPKDSLIFRRCKYVVEENLRLLSGCEDLKRGDLAALGKKMFRSHEGLSKEYEVSCKELDFLVEAVKNDASVLGARMMGGGFGGCTINIVKEQAVKGLINRLEKEYKLKMNMDLTAYVAEIEDGTSIL